jgi:hypothetical protein
MLNGAILLRYPFRSKKEVPAKPAKGKAEKKK